MAADALPNEASTDVFVIMDGKKIHAVLTPAQRTMMKEFLEHTAKPGDRMADGTVFAGVSPRGAPLYTTPEDGEETIKGRDALAYAFALTVQHHLDHDDWRVPNIEQLRVLV